MTGTKNRDRNEKSWDVQWAINNSEHKVTKRTPSGEVFENQAPGLLDIEGERQTM